MGRATSKGNEAKPKTKQPSNMHTRDSNTGGSDLWFNMLPLDHRGTPVMSKTDDITLPELNQTCSDVNSHYIKLILGISI